MIAGIGRKRIRMGINTRDTLKKNQGAFDIMQYKVFLKQIIEEQKHEVSGIYEEYLTGLEIRG